MTGQKTLQTKSIGQPMDKLSNGASIRELTSPNSCMIFSRPTIVYTCMTRHAPPNVRCAMIWMKNAITCPDTTRRRWRLELLSTIRGKCDKLRTRPILTKILLERISSWLYGRTVSPYRYELRYHQLSLQKQNDIG